MCLVSLWQVSDEEDVPMSTVELKLGENIFEIHVTKVKEFVSEFFCGFQLDLIIICCMFVVVPLLQVKSSITALHSPYKLTYKMSVYANV